ncbi:hypothetical protein [Kineosporia succinea]|uniref:Flp pilus assembly pilin Flp n=1 Tax=Kineosporia succinea TaxID=84632 RepID=A0ABT9P4U0_9ACTN|nr:hypothetical protein [Kineosporia succinea]MDP9827697.1 hypothetical protein [Kineosporia succinea]
MNSGPFRFPPGTLIGHTEMVVRGRIDRARARVIQGPADLGASVVEWVIISAVLVALAAAVGTALYNKIMAKANTINLDTPVGGGNP